VTDNRKRQNRDVKIPYVSLHHGKTDLETSLALEITRPEISPP